MQRLAASTLTCSNPPGLEAVYAENEQRAIDAAIQRKAEKAARLEAKITRIVPSAYKDATVTHSDCETWLRDYMKGERRNLILTGSIGAGKTTNACAMCAYLMHNGVNCDFYTADGMLRAIKRAYNGELSEDEAIERLTSIPVLFIDDMAKETRTDWSGEKLFTIIDERTAKQKPVVVTTNYDAKALCKRYAERGEALLSRLCGGATIAHFTGADMRLMQ